MSRQHFVFAASILLGALLGLIVSSTAPAAMAAPAGYQIPFFGKAAITNGPGMGLHTNRSGEAIDYTPRYGWWNYVTSAQAGTVVVSRNVGEGFGHVIVIRHGDSATYSYYAHLLERYVNEGTVVSRGQNIGKVGSSGCPGCAVHLHFESRTGVTEPVTDYNLYNTGTAVSIRDVKGNGWFPWYPTNGRDSGLVAYSPNYPKGQCVPVSAPVTVIWPKPSEISGGPYIAGFSYEFSTSVTTIPDTTLDGNREDGSASYMISIGVKWHFHMRIRDTNGNWSAGDWHTVHAGSYCRLM